MGKEENTATIDSSSEEAIEEIQSLVFGDLSKRNESGELEEEESEGTEEGTSTETDDDESAASEEGEEGDEEQEEDEGGEEDAADQDIDYASLTEPLKDFLPEDREVKTKEDFTQALSDFSKQYREEIEANESLVNLFENHSEFGALARELNKNPDASFHQALYRVIGDGEQNIVPDKKEDPEAYAEYMIAKKEREREEARAQKEKEQNLQTSEQAVKKFRETNDFGEQDINNIMSKAHEMIQSISKGKVTEEFLDIMAKGMNYEKAMEETSKEAERKGRNAGATKMRKKKKGDGIPKLSGKGGSSKKSGKKAEGLVEASLQRAIDPNVW